MLRRARQTALFALKPPPKPSCHRRSPRLRPVVCSTLARMYLRKIACRRLYKCEGNQVGQDWPAYQSHQFQQHLAAGCPSHALRRVVYFHKSH